MLDLTDADYDALFAVMQADMPRMWREIFPKILAQLEGTGTLTITVTDTEVVVSSAKLPQTAVFRVARTPSISPTSGPLHATGTHLAVLDSQLHARHPIMAYVVKIYDPLGTVPEFYRSVLNTWVPSPAAAPLRVFANEGAARAFIAIQGSFTALEMCVENVLAR
jgi:hypothetical protein